MKKHITDIIKLAALILAAAAIMLFIGSDLLACTSCGSGCAKACSGGAGKDTVSLEYDDLTMTEGEQLTLEAVIPKGGTAVWLSSNSEIISCDNGTITAHQAGESVISVSSGHYTDYVRVSVVQTVVSDSSVLISRLASDGAPMEELRAMQNRLEFCTGSYVEDVKEIINLLADCAAGNADRDSLVSAAEGAGLDGQTVLDAASYCWSAGEREKHTAVISFTGDVTLGMCNERSHGYYFPAVYGAQDSRTYPFDRVKRFFLNDDLTVINFEGTLTEREDFVDKPFFFRGDPEYAAMLTQSGIEAATVANNHALDYYIEGYEDTLRHLGDAGVTAFDEGAPAEYTIKTADGSEVRVVLIAFNLIGNDRTFPEEEYLEQIAKYKKDKDTVVAVSVHWGIEYQQKPRAAQSTFAHKLIEAGADIVVGHHPHILQGIEEYNGRYIAYSLGNFCFGGNTEAKNPQSLILQANVDYIDGRATVSGISLIPCYTTSSGSIVNNYQPCVKYGEKSEKLMELLIKRSGYIKNGAEEFFWSGL